MSLLAPMTAHSLGVGELKLHSALNQKLNAEIGLSLSAGEHLDDIKVTLATPDQFDKLGISWSYFISKIQFKPIVKSNGKVVIKVTSDQILQEPILDFLLEVSWPSGEIFVL
jgi:pilus assembly protein FimV